MNKILSLLAATILSLCSFYSTCWYSPYQGYSYILILVFVGLFMYMLLVFVLYRARFNRFRKKETTETTSQV